MDLEFKGNFCFFAPACPELSRPEDRESGLEQERRDHFFRGENPISPAFAAVLCWVFAENRIMVTLGSQSNGNVINYVWECAHTTHLSG